jgi:hypothetical protein
MRDKKTEAMVSIALELSRDPDNVIGDVVTDEELAAYLEGGLDPVRRAQLDSYIANDAEVYARWIRFVENMEIYELEESTETEMSSSKEGFLSSIVNNLKQLFSHGAFIPSSALSLFTIGFLAFTLFQQSNTIDDLYAEYGIVTDDSTLSLPTRSFNPLGTENKASAEDFLLREGITKGLKSLGLDESGFGSESTRSLVDIKISDVDRNTYIDLGRWAALSHYQCLQKSRTYLQKAKPVYDSLQEKLKTIDSEYSKALIGSINGLFIPKSNASDDSGQYQYLCYVADFIIQQGNI